MDKELYSDLKKEGYSLEEKYFHDLEMERKKQIQIEKERAKKTTQLPPTEPTSKKKHFKVNTKWVP